MYQTMPSGNCTTSAHAFISTISYTVLSTVDASQVTIISFPSSGHILSEISTSVSLSITRVAEETSYRPSLIHTTGPALPNALPGQGILKRDDSPISIVILPPSKLRSRSYDYDSCDNVPPSHDLSTNSLTDVCHFVANAQNYFVSLVPISSAAYLPSWVGYLIQAFAALIEIWSIVLILISGLMLG